jgi:hypothetical protein
MTHHNDNEKADFWTKYGGVIEFGREFVSTTYWFGGLVDYTLYAVGSDVALTMIGLSWWGLGIGAGVAVFSAIGTTYCHYIQNLNNQIKQENLRKELAAKNSIKDSSRKASFSEDFIEPDLELGNSTTPYQKLSDVSTHAAVQAKLSALPQVQAKLSAMPPVQAKLSAPQKAALVGDGISHTGENAGPAMFVFNLATRNVLLPKWVPHAVTIASTVFVGIFGSWANVRTCRENLYEYNQRQLEKQQPTLRVN